MMKTRTKIFLKIPQEKVWDEGSAEVEADVVWEDKIASEEEIRLLLNPSS
ncbi:MAG: hypothetical protein PHD61_09610 [Bacteroidales bacterium]|nr:hypothetical protein [Bacteroidales bacterium]